MAARRSRATFWLVVLGLYAVSALVLVLVTAPAPFLFAGVLAGAVPALRMPDPQHLPEQVRMLGLAIIGVGAGARIDEGVVSTLLDEPIAIACGVIATLVVSMAAGQLLRFSTAVNGPTAVMASIAGGASGVVAVAREVDADETIVLAVQYLRVVFVLVTIPVVASWLGGTTAPGTSEPASLPQSLAFTVVTVAAGLTLAHLWRFSASNLVLPLLMATTLTVMDVFPHAGVPEAALGFGYATTGLMVGLSFRPRTVRVLARIMPLALVQLFLGVAGCAAVGLAFSAITGIAPLDGYLATTPGGLPAVTAVAIGSGAGVGLILTMQLLRIFLALLLAPVVGSWLQRRGR